MRRSYCYPAIASYPVLPIYRLKLETIIHVVCDHTGVSFSDISKRCRRRRYVRARHLIMWLAKTTDCKTTLASIAHNLGLTDHTTVIHGLMAIEQDIRHEPGLNEMVAKLRDELKRLQLQHELAAN